MSKQLSNEQKREIFRKNLLSKKLLVFPGAYSPLTAMLIEEKGFGGVYISGAVLSNDLGLPDIGLNEFSSVSYRGRQIAQATNLPSLIDMDTGFGEGREVYDNIQKIEDCGLSGCHIEDQIERKKCGHLDNKKLIKTSEMVDKIKQASKAKKDRNFIVMARTDARGVLGMEEALSRAQAYVDAGADMIFPEALKDEREFELFRKKIQVPLLANMTEFGKSKLLSQKTLENLGYNIVIYPVTLVRLAMQAVEEGLDVIRNEGTQKNIIEKMQTRSRLYELLKYEEKTN